MSRANPDIVKLKLDEFSDAPADSSKQGSASASAGENAGEGASPTSAQAKARNSTLAPRGAESRASRYETASGSSLSTPNTSHTASPKTTAALKPAASSSSIASSGGPAGSGAGADKASRSHLTPAHSVLELKRFFGKGRTKHEHGVKMKAPDDKKKPRATFNLFGLGKKKGSSSGSAPGSAHPSAPPSPSPSIFHFNLHHHSHHHHHDNNSKHEAAAAPKDESQFVDPDAFIVKGKPPKDLDPTFVVHGPDYEADWDPFHVFGLAPNSERLPFLESGITKYGEVGRDMGSGAGGSVRMMERPSDNKLFAVKEFRPRRQNETPQKYAKHMTAEYALGAALHHKNIIETIDLIKEGDKYYEVMEYGPHDFFELVMSGSMTTPQINSSFRQIVNGVAYLHSMGVAHRDLKLDNCVVTDDGTVKLIDFGSAVVFKYPMSPQIHLARGVLGSDPYLAPEVFLKHPYQPQCADVWSCGIIYCCTYLRRFPWKLPQKEDASFRKFSENSGNIDGKHPPQDNPRKILGPWRLLRLLPRDSRTVISSVLKIKVEDRYTIEKIEEDPWFKQIQEISVLPAPLPDHSEHR